MAFSHTSACPYCRTSLAEIDPRALDKSHWAGWYEPCTCEEYLKAHPALVHHVYCESSNEITTSTQEPTPSERVKKCPNCYTYYWGDLWITPRSISEEARALPFQKFFNCSFDVYMVPKIARQRFPANTHF